MLWLTLCTVRLPPPSTALCVPRTSPPPLPTAARHNTIAGPSLPWFFARPGARQGIRQFYTDTRTTLSGTEVSSTLGGKELPEKFENWRKCGGPELSGRGWHPHSRARDFQQMLASNQWACRVYHQTNYSAVFSVSGEKIGTRGPRIWEPFAIGENEDP